MQEAKPWYLSKTIWSGLATSVLGTLSIVGLIPYMDVVIYDEIATSLLGLGTIYGRVVAQQKIQGRVVQ